MNEELQRYKKEAAIPQVHDLRRFAVNNRKRGMAALTPVVREKAEAILSSLMDKFKDKLAADPNHYKGILTGVAIAQAKRALGLVISCKAARRKGWYRKRRMSALMTALGLQDPVSNDKDRSPMLDKPRVYYANTEGI